MDPTDKKALAELARSIDALAEGCPVETAAPEKAASPEVKAVVASLERLNANLAELCRFTVALANGQIEAEATAKSKLLSPLKALQSSLKHLTWQTQEVAAGNLTHQVDFLGDFSVAFNSMVQSLREKRRFEQHMLQESKLASIGIMANGIAHEINTPLQYVVGNLQFLAGEFKHLLDVVHAVRKLAATARQEPSLAGPLLELDSALANVDLSYLNEEVPVALEDSISGVGQMSHIVSSLREFADIGSGEPIPIDINRLVENALTVSHHAWFEVAEVTKELHADLPRVDCCRVELGQVLFNLILNATQSITSSGKPRPGRISITTGVGDGCVFIGISDTGMGIPEANRHKIFEPFFSTSSDKGVGMGLAMCRDIVENKYGGQIEVTSNVGEGATFTIKLPETHQSGDGFGQEWRFSKLNRSS
jgi:signal transduction histidine kinase